MAGSDPGEWSPSRISYSSWSRLSVPLYFKARVVRSVPGRVSPAANGPSGGWTGIVSSDKWLQRMTIHFPLVGIISRRGTSIPTWSYGQIADVKTSFDEALDFTSPKLIGQDIQSTTGLCGDNCTGYDTCFIIDRPTNISDWTSSPKAMVPALNMFSTTTGISMLVSTNQHAVQIYTCSGQNGTLPVKQSQVDRNNQQNTGNTTHPVDTVQKYGCIVIEPEGWIDGVNNPQWGQLQYQIFGPNTPPAVNWATYVLEECNGEIHVNGEVSD
ncbi:hypothetical protein CISG_00155 [Coccidioides immitis RMSCC 3703]|uniref:Uncharacterized protein n=1 Tax=Coccidioides immitis RMSCC 3703 TaxID=454286 RepID=A0A0J8QHC5_COCIT|nr:hypothetical protein CISG_00155 [Coccidioides immitis RMSCC 3703]